MSSISIFSFNFPRQLVPICVMALAVVSLHAQAVNPARLKINGIIGLHSGYAQVVKAFGKPATETKARLEQCTGGYEKTVEYDGAMFYFMSGTSRDGKTFEIESFIVNSSKWTVSGVKVGDGETIVKRKFGRSFTVGKDPATGTKIWTYEMDNRNGPGQTTVTFKNGEVSRISSALAVC